MYLKRLIRECLKAIWRCLTKKRYIQDYKKKKAILIIVFVFIDCYVLNDLIDGLTQLDFNETITAEASVGDVVQEAATFDTTNGKEERNDADLSVSVPPAVGKKATVTAYNSVPEQTDGDPCRSADGTNICEFDGCVIAQNGVPFGTKVEIEGFGVCEVHDRKNSRYNSNWIDIYFGGADKVDEALDFGKRELNIKLAS